MVKNHLFSLAAPKNWSVDRKKLKYVARPLPGAHPLFRCFTLNYLLKTILNSAKTTKEVKTILNLDNVLVDGVVRKDHKYSVGFMDIIEIPKLNEFYRVVFNIKNRFVLVPIKKEECNIKILKIIRKSILKKGKLQLTFHDGRNILLDKFEGNIGDSVVFDLEKKKLVKTLSLEQGCLVYMNQGSNVGRIGKVNNILKSEGFGKTKLVVDIEGSECITLKDYVFVIGKTKSEVDLGDKL